MRYARVAAIEDAYLKTEIDKTVSPRDHMYNTGQDWYFTVGLDGIRVVLRALSISTLGEVTRILDLPCGHGRVARHLRAAFPRADISFADIDTDGADFCANQFRGTAIHSQPDLSQVALGDGYDIIWIGSLFTHVDEARAETWTRHLCKRLSPRGILIATLHGNWSKEVQRKYGAMIGDAEWQQILAGYEASGWGYARYPGEDDYGVSLCRASTIIAMASRIEGVRILGYNERAWAGNHDVLMIERRDRMEAW
ncbi:class I SAM-dependent methyltransferase [Acidisoma cellulosilytica]|uniref:Class I SAM-dependent methyltransferase n=1 Tax=Acidisoma cellulosilyticum TaxID=2802395 RepID=A0A963Z679_9PROT|nr:class I SAM-dependent methyltransferase [Acidisoma cellulosilyticum]MCB8882815.1 class I SAM-dependent methyltransferase [Acidisoma cellulosilyticum]